MICPLCDADLADKRDALLVVTCRDGPIAVCSACGGSLPVVTVRTERELREALRDHAGMSDDEVDELLDDEPPEPWSDPSPAADDDA